MSETQIKTTYGKDRDGRNGRTRFRMEPNLVVDIDTSKSGRGSLVTGVSVSTDDGSGFLTHRFSFSGKGDFSKRYIVTKPSRVTERAVREQHEQALGMIDQFKADVQAHYEQQAQLQAEAV